MPYGILDVYVEGAVGIKDTTILGKGSPYCTLTVGNQVFSSPPIEEGGTHPYFNTKFEFDVDRSTPQLSLAIYSKKTMTDDDLLGYCTILFKEAFYSSHSIPVTPYDLTRPSGRHGGLIRLSLNFRAQPRPQGYRELPRQHHPGPGAHVPPQLRPPGPYGQPRPPQGPPQGGYPQQPRPPGPYRHPRPPSRGPPPGQYGQPRPPSLGPPPGQYGQPRPPQRPPQGQYEEQPQSYDAGPSYALSMPQSPFPPQPNNYQHDPRRMNEEESASGSESSESYSDGNDSPPSPDQPPRLEYHQPLPQPGRARPGPPPGRGGPRPRTPGPYTNQSPTVGGPPPQVAARVGVNPQQQQPSVAGSFLQNLGGALLGAAVGSLVGADGDIVSNWGDGDDVSVDGSFGNVDTESYGTVENSYYEESGAIVECEAYETEYVRAAEVYETYDDSSAYAEQNYVRDAAGAPAPGFQPVGYANQPQAGRGRGRGRGRGPPPPGRGRAGPSGPARGRAGPPGRGGPPGRAPMRGGRAGPAMARGGPPPMRGRAAGF